MSSGEGSCDCAERDRYNITLETCSKALLTNVRTYGQGDNNRDGELTIAAVNLP